jgi:hypothetical protein
MVVDVADTACMVSSALHHHGCQRIVPSRASTRRHGMWSKLAIICPALGYQIQVHALYPFINNFFIFFWVLLILRFCFVCIHSDMLKKLSGLRACKHHMQHTAAQWRSLGGLPSWKRNCVFVCFLKIERL